MKIFFPCIYSVVSSTNTTETAHGKHFFLHAVAPVRLFAPMSSVVKPSISLSQDLWDFVEKEAKDGNHNNRSRVVSEALKLLKASRAKKMARLAMQRKSKTA